MRVAYWVRGAEYEALAEFSIASVRKVYPGAQVEVVTDDGRRPAMVANLDAQLSVLARADAGEPVLFLDVDVLVRKAIPLGPDLTVTWRDAAKEGGVAGLMPYNYGVVGVRASVRTYEAFLWMRAQVLQMSAQNQGWYGNQMALAALCGARPNEGTAEKRVRLRWSATDPGHTELSVLQLPCETWNYTPQAEGEEVSARAVLHFKGNRKDMMLAYARAA